MKNIEITFEEKNIIIRKKIGNIPEISKISTSVFVQDIIDTGIDIRVFLKIDNVNFTRTIVLPKDYIPLTSISNEDLLNKILNSL